MRLELIAGTGMASGNRTSFGARYCPMFGLVLILVFGSAAKGLAQTKIPACPAGSQSMKLKDEKRPYIYYKCALPEKTNNLETCRQWEGTRWDTDHTTVCGSRVGTAIEYTGSLKCPVAEQVYLWDSKTNALSKEISCLPSGWGVVMMTGGSCPRGYISGTPAIFGQDNCYGPLRSSQSGVLAQHDLLAHDINGFTLDMTVKQVAALANRIQAIGNGQYKATVDGVEYDFGFSVLGHLYRIDSEQNLGHFIPGRAFANTLAGKMSAKFGPPQSDQLPNGPLSWGFSERYQDRGGPVLDRQTISLSAMLTGGYGQPIILHLKLMDFRIMRRDLAKANAVPRSRAESDTKF